MTELTLDLFYQKNTTPWEMLATRLGHNHSLLTTQEQRQKIVVPVALLVNTLSPFQMRHVLKYTPIGTMLENSAVWQRIEERTKEIILDELQLVLKE